jgi:RND superfamily putative drug exporter
VRTITVPALAAMLGRANWWPAKAIAIPGGARGSAKSR